MTDKVMITLADLAVLAFTADRNGTQSAFLSLAMQWASEAQKEIERLRAALDFISTADTGGELFPVGPSDREYAEDGNTLIRHVGPWYFLDGTGETFLDAVEDEMKKAAAA